MKRTYDIGTDTNEITLHVRVGTVGTAYTSVYLARKGGASSKIAESDEDSGSIKERKIGQSDQLRFSYLIIRTTVDFSNIDEAQWLNQADNLFLRYRLQGGFSGTQTYNQDTDDVDIVFNGRIVIITKPIELI
jgi:hypothetical protein